jgi:hypothetical protein
MQPVATIVDAGTSLSGLGKRLSAQKALHQQLKNLLPTPLNSQLKAAVLQNGNLSLFVPSPVWASRFRYILPQLQKELSTHGIHVNHLRTRILPSEAAKPKGVQQRRRISLSTEASKQLRESAAAIDDAALREALLRISRHGEENPAHPLAPS